MAIKKGFSKPISQKQYSISIGLCPECGEETFIDSINKTGEPDNWEDNIVCPCCQWRYEEMEEEVKELEFC